MSLPAMIFAAGLGTRMGELTRNCPKPLLKVKGRRLLDHAIGLAISANCAPIVVNVHYLGEQIIEHCATHWPEVIISDERAVLLDTGGGLKYAAPLLQAPFVATLNADILWHGENPLSTLTEAWSSEGCDALLLTKSNVELGRQNADFARADNGALTRTSPGQPGQTYLGAQIIAMAPVLAHMSDAFSLNAVWDTLAARRRLCGRTYNGDWLDVGTAEAYQTAQAQPGDRGNG